MAMVVFIVQLGLSAAAGAVTVDVLVVSVGWAVICANALTRRASIGSLYDTTAAARPETELRCECVRRT